MSVDLTWASALAVRLIELAGWEVLFSAVLFVIVALLVRLLRRAAPSLRHALWGLVLLRLVLPVDLAQPVSLGGLATRVALLEGSRSAAWLNEWPGHGAVDGGGFGSVVVPQASGPDGTAAPDWRLPLALAWLVGALVMGGRALRCRLRYRSVIRRSVSLRDPALLARASNLRRRMGVRRPVQVVTSAERYMPFTSGVVRPVIFIPQAVLSCGDGDVVDAVLAHELAHVRRWDDLVVRLQLLVTALYFFHPVAWLAGSRMRQEAERACDELVLARTGIAPRVYGRSLLAVLRLGLTGVPAGAPALSQANTRLRMRIESIVGSAVRRSRAPHPVVVALAFGLLLLPMGSVADGRAGAGDGDSAARGAQRVALTNPMPGARITSKYGPAIDPFTGAERHHDGIDVAGPGATPIFAPAPGRVELATTEYEGGASYGTVVLVDHGDGVKTFYSHLGRLLVRPGQRVERGDPLGTQGSTGRVTGPHLHFEVWVDGARKNPANFVSDWRS